LAEIPRASDEARECKVYRDGSARGDAYWTGYVYVTCTRGGKLPGKERQARAWPIRVEPVYVHPVSARRRVGEGDHFVRIAVRGLAYSHSSTVNVHIEIRSRRCDEAFVNSDSEQFQPSRHDNILMNGASRIVRIECLIRILCHYFSKGSRCDKAARGKTQCSR